jgi:hypothetical protein
VLSSCACEFIVYSISCPSIRSNLKEQERVKEEFAAHRKYLDEGGKLLRAVSDEVCREEILELSLCRASLWKRLKKPMNDLFTKDLTPTELQRLSRLAEEHLKPEGKPKTLQQRRHELWEENIRLLKLVDRLN